MEKGTLPKLSAPTRIRTMRCRHLPTCAAAAVGVFALMASFPAAELGARSWEPSPLPSEIRGVVKAKILVPDGTASMLKGTLPARVRTATRQAIATAENGTYLVLATFGTSGRVVADRFLFTPYDRQYLLEACEGVQMDDQHTDVAVLEKLIDDVRVALVHRFAGHGVHLEAEILTDARPAPPHRVHGQALSQTFDLILGMRPTKTALGGGLFMLSLSFDQAEANVPLAERATATPTTLALPTATAAPVATADVPAHVLSLRSSVYVALVVALMALLVAVYVRRTFVRDLDMPEPSNRDRPAVLAVTEIDQSNGQDVVMRRDEKIPVVTDTPVIFGTDPARCACIVKAIPGIEEAEFFRVLVTGQGIVRVTAVPGAQCDGQPVPKRGLAFRYRHPFDLRLATRAWQIAIAEPDGASAAVDDLFLRLGSHAQQEGQLA